MSKAMGSGKWEWTSPGYQKRRAPKDVTNLYSCTCGVYNSVIPPEPCPIHDPERAYWRMKLLQEFGGQAPVTTTTTIPKYEAPRVEKDEVHFNYAEFGKHDVLACGADPGADDIRWARVLDWVTCPACRVR
jgi:hypothetical protein